MGGRVADVPAAMWVPLRVRRHPASTEVGLGDPVVSNAGQYCLRRGRDLPERSAGCVGRGFQADGDVGDLRSHRGSTPDLHAFEQFTVCGLPDVTMTSLRELAEQSGTPPTTDTADHRHRRPPTPPTTDTAVRDAVTAALTQGA
ncbi:MAG: hypothetical protein M3Y48_24210 [Actinomycetota bacterium]|nr:hypothetical protein [Actinomycetota bacterium]